MGRVQLVGPGLGIDRFKAHKSHQPLNPFTVDLIAQSAQMILHRVAAPAGGLKRLLIDDAHQLQIKGLNRFVFVIVAGAIKTQYLTLSGQAQLRICGIDHLTAFIDTWKSSFRDKKIVFHLQFADLPIQFIDFGFDLFAGAVVLVEKIGGSFKQRAFPSADHCGVDARSAGPARRWSLRSLKRPEPPSL